MFDSILAYLGFVLRSDSVGYNMIKGKNGEYNLNIFEFEYPESFFEQEYFLFYLYHSLIYLSFYKKRLIFLFSENFYSDLCQLKENFLISKEKILSKNASDLTKEEIEQLLLYANIKKDTEKIKKQNLLEIQIEILKKILLLYYSYEENQEENITEASKRLIILKIVEIRQKIIEYFSNQEIMMKISFENVKETFLKENPYYKTRDFSKKNFSVNLNKMNNYKKYNIIPLIYEKDYYHFYKKQSEISQSFFFVYHKDFNGYWQVGNKTFFFIGNGEKKIFKDFSKIIKFKINKFTLKELPIIENKIKTEFSFKDITKTY